jgi:ankyrin repeat protein
MESPFSFQVNTYLSIPFLRIWCILEIVGALDINKPLVVGCGYHTLSKTGVSFISDLAVLYHMQLLIDIKKAQSKFKADYDRIIHEVESSFGIEKFERVVLGAIVGAFVASKCRPIQLAALGNRAVLESLCANRGGMREEQHRLEIFGALSAAAAGGYHELLTYVLEAVADTSADLVSGSDSDGTTLLMHAVRGGHVVTVSAILKLTNDKGYVNQLSSDRWTALAYAAQFGSPEIVETLISHGAATDVVLSGGLTALGLACQTGEAQCVTVLLRASADVHVRDEVGYTPLRHAMYYGKSYELVEMLIKSGADPNSRDNWGALILSYGVSSGYINSVKALLETAPTVFDVNLADFRTGNTCLDDAINGGFRDVAALIRQHGGRTTQELCGFAVCGKLLEADVQTVEAKYNINREEAGFALSLFIGRLDWLLARYNPADYPRPGDVVNYQTAKHALNGIVSRGPDWNYGGDGGSEAVGYLVSNEAKDGYIRVAWPFGYTSTNDKSVFRIGAEGKFDLVYASYQYPIHSLSTERTQAFVEHDVSSSVVQTVSLTAAVPKSNCCCLG